MSAFLSRTLLCFKLEFHIKCFSHAVIISVLIDTKKKKKSYFPDTEHLENSKNTILPCWDIVFQAVKQLKDCLQQLHLNHCLEMSLYVFGYSPAS